MMRDDTFETLAAAVTGARPPRVWSLLVTLFGDLAQEAGAEVRGALLGALCARMGLRPEAMRVALHRLRKDGWIVSRRQGRGSLYALSPQGRAESAAASPRIYARTAPEAGAGRAWLVLGDPAHGLPPPPAGGAAISGAVQLWPAAPSDPALFASEVTPSTPLPGWMSARLCDAARIGEARALLERLTGLERMLDPATLEPLEVAALRVLLVHEWRRVLLRTPALPDHVFPTGWPGPDCRRRTHALLARLPRPDLARLEAAATGPAT